MKNQNELMSIQGLVLQQFKNDPDSIDGARLSVIPTEVLNLKLEETVNKIYAMLALNNERKLTKEELAIFKTLVVKKFGYYSVKSIKDAFVWALSESDLKVMRLDFRTLSDVLRAYKKHLQEKRSQNHNRVKYNPNQIELKTTKMPEWFDKKYFERSAKIINKNRQKIKQVLPETQDHYGAHIEGFKNDVALIDDKNQLLQALEYYSKRSELKEHAAIIAERIQELN